MPPIKGKGLVLPFAALTIPIIAKTITKIEPTGPIKNHPIKGIMLEIIEMPIANKNSTNP